MKEITTVGVDLAKMVFTVHGVDAMGRVVLRKTVRRELLATVEAIFNLGTLGRNDTSATPMSDLFRGGIP